ncbi:MAG TPA: CaiB/BaiF CoA-transferase family protein [Burkholderiales bacterium]|nr:CaiB/BaiF CoA-transferase family protein [Burkholderiales bacterium]
MPQNAPPQARRPALAGLRVIDLSRVLAGPTCAQTLADLGADVVKIERPGVGDDTRPWGPPWLPDARGEPTRDSTYFSSANRNKRSIEIDLANDAGAALARRLAQQADVLIENYKVGDLARRGLDYPALATLNPRLVYCSITGFGQTGPLRERPGYDYIFQGVGGLMSVTGHPDGVPGGGPMKIGASIVDLSTGLYAGIAILAALRERDASGLGQHIDMALFDTVAALTMHQSAAYFQTGKVPVRAGTSSAGIMMPYETFRCADGHLIVACGNNSQWQSLCAALAREDLASDPRLATPSGRQINRDFALEELRKSFAVCKVDEIAAKLDAGGVANGPINDLKQVFDMEQARERGLKVELPRSDGTRVAGVGSPVRLSATPVQYRCAAPKLGEHTGAVLSDWLGTTPDEIEGLRAAGALG